MKKKTKEYSIFFGHVNRQEPERNRNRIEFHLINAVCYARPNCVKCVPAALVATSLYLIPLNPPTSPIPPSNNQGTVGVISPLATDREVSKSQYVIILSIFIFPIFSRALQIRHGIYYIGGLKFTN